jgi:hypothetical protein
MKIVAVVLLGSLSLAACGPIPLERAEEECFQRARLAVQPRGTVEIGASTGGPHLGADIEVSPDFIQGRDPSDVYNSCVFARSGQPPSQPLYSRPDWRG